MNMERLMEVRWGNIASRRQLYERKVELHHGDWSQVKQISVKTLEFLGGEKGGFLTDTIYCSALSPSTCSKLIRVLLGHEDLLLSPSTHASVSCNVWEGLHQPWQSSGISVYLGPPSGKISSGDGSEQPVLSHPLCAAWSHPRQLGWVLQGNHLSPFINHLYCSSSEVATVLST